MKSDFRLGRNFYKGVFGDAVNVLLAAAAYNFKRAMRLLWTIVEKISETLYWKNVSLEYIFLRDDYIISYFSMTNGLTP